MDKLPAFKATITYVDDSIEIIEDIDLDNLSWQFGADTNVLSIKLDRL